MSLLFLGTCVFLLWKKFKKLSGNQKIFVSIWLVVASLGLFAYTNFLIDVGWEYGIPGADMKNYFKAAQAICNGATWDELASISMLYFAELKIGTVTYFLFSYFVAALIAIPVINYQITLYIIYISFLVLCCLAAINIAELFQKDSDRKLKTRYLILTLLCGGLCFAAYRLLRDVILFYLITVVLLFMKKHSEKSEMYKSIVLILICTMLRAYSLVLILPFFLYRYFSKRWAMILVAIMPVVLITSNNILAFVKQFFSMPWDFTVTDVSEMIHFLMFPNIFSQTQLLYIWNQVPHYTNYLAGSNLPGMYYIMAVWNIIVMPLLLLGIIFTFKKNLNENLVWLSSLLNICIIYSILYSSESGLETRHKIMILIPVVYFASCGYQYLQKFKVGNISLAMIYTLAMMAIVPSLFLLYI